MESLNINSLPSEILINVFIILPGAQIIKCRKICRRWKEIIDELKRNNSLWRDIYKRDFENIYKSSQLKCCPGLLWFDVYKSLSLWPKLADAMEDSDEFAGASFFNEEIKNFNVLSNGTLGIHKHQAIVYYDYNSHTGTWNPSKRNTVTGNYLAYSENEDIITLLNFHLQLHISCKASSDCRMKTNLIIDDVKTFLLRKDKVYYVTMTDEIFVCNLERTHQFHQRYIERCDHRVLSLGYHNDCLYILTFRRNILKVIGDNMFKVCSLDANCNLLNKLREYNLLENLDWRIYFQWIYVLNHNIPEGPLRDIVTVRSHGDVLFVGSNCGVLRIYYAPASQEFDILKADPIKQYNFMDRYDCPVLSLCPIIQIDVLEKLEGHIVLVAMPKKIAVLNFSHNMSIVTK